MPDGRRILQCHSRGDKRFSPFFCTVKAFGVSDSIENHYQKSKLFKIDNKWTTPLTWKEAKEWEQHEVYRNKDLFKLPNGKIAPIEFQVFGFYSGMWLKYLDANPELTAMASSFDDYEDIFKGDFPLCQADCVRLYCKEGRRALLATCEEFFKWIKEQ
jgi:hypothetical protein